MYECEDNRMTRVACPSIVIGISPRYRHCFISAPMPPRAALTVCLALCASNACHRCIVLLARSWWCVGVWHPLAPSSSAQSPSASSLSLIRMYGVSLRIHPQSPSMLSPSYHTACMRLYGVSLAPYTSILSRSHHTHLSCLPRTIHIYHVSLPVS